MKYMMATLTGTWNDVAEDLEENEEITNDTTVVSDKESLMDAFDTSYRSHQVDLVHVGQTIRDNL
ncbi:transposase (ISH6) [Natrialba hulunbeirensis JCM 10989]|uniref:Transposase (ISH6) n=1 Tax=Natrialba hulunbeirensis JCM 10989 TaxID=1227493 RepID=M0A440_9EURY|nr:transposase (ISH6) [Natrialba hulunbeirensis JCM 10989]